MVSETNKNYIIEIVRINTTIQDTGLLIWFYVNIL